MIHGRNLIILADGEAIAAAKSCEISLNTEAYEVSSPATAGWRYHKAGRSEWSVIVSTLVTEIRTRFNLGQMVTLTMAVCDANGMTTDRMTGTAFIKKSEITAQMGNLVQGAFSFQGIGVLKPYIPLPYDAEIEYLESTGTQWIDTGYYPNTNSKVRVVWMPTEINTNGYFGSRSADSSTTSLSRYTCTTFSSGSLFAFAMSYNGWVSNRFTLTVNTKYDCLAENGKYSCNGTQYTSITLSNFTTGKPFLLSRYYTGVNSTGYFNSKMRIYAFQVWESDILKMDCVPVRYNGIGYLYDKVSDTLFGNDGTGAFILGPDIIET